MVSSEKSGEAKSRNELCGFEKFRGHLEEDERTS